MKRSLSVLAAVIAVIFVYSIGYTFEGKGHGDGAPKHEILSQLPADKAALFRQTMKEAREKTTENREQMKNLKKELRAVLTAPMFDEAMFLEKMNTLQLLRQKERQTMVQGFAQVAQQCTQEERKILAEIIPFKIHHHGRHAPRWDK